MRNFAKYSIQIILIEFFIVCRYGSVATTASRLRCLNQSATPTHTQTLRHRDTQIHTHTHTVSTHTDTHLHTHTHTRAHPHTHAHPRAHTHTRTDTHAHTHNSILYLNISMTKKELSVFEKKKSLTLASIVI